MNATRSDTEFCLRYAVRVLERYARWWHNVDVSVRVFALFSGTSAFGALMSQSKFWTLTAGLFFAFLQAVEYTIGPAKREQEARASRALYLAVLARQLEMNDSQLEAAYLAACTEDPVIVPDSLKRLAYNDILDERGADQNSRYALTKWQELVNWVA